METSWREPAMSETLLDWLKMLDVRRWWKWLQTSSIGQGFVSIVAGLNCLFLATLSKDDAVAWAVMASGWIVFAFADFLGRSNRLLGVPLNVAAIILMLTAIYLYLFPVAGFLSLA
jgi:hypothetical protein